MSTVEDIKALFAKLVGEPRELMLIMEESGDILSGSRAANFFVDGVCEETSDWDFYCRCCDANKIGAECKLYRYLESTGCTWSKVEQTYNDQILLVHRGTLGNKSVQIIGHYLEDTIEGILGYHSTVTQSIIAHDSALCMYYDLLKDKHAVEWTTKLSFHAAGVWHTEDTPSYGRADDPISKYTKRGIAFIPYEQYAKDIGFKVDKPRLRKTNDNSSKLLSDNDECSLSSIVWLECEEGCTMLRM